jgi:hypothetical protein
MLVCDDTQDMVARLLQAGLAAAVPAPSSSESSPTPEQVPTCVGYKGVSVTATMFSRTMMTTMVAQPHSTSLDAGGGTSSPPEFSRQPIQSSN